jgi:hypothetical protein
LNWSNGLPATQTELPLLIFLKDGFRNNRQVIWINVVTWLFCACVGPQFGGAGAVAVRV